MSTSYTWEYQIRVDPYDRLMDVLEAFYASYPGGDYTRERRERYKLEFRRGLWRRSWLGFGELVPDRLVKGQFNLWPVRVTVLVRPSPEVFLVTVRYVLFLPSSVPQLAPAVQSSVDQHARRETADLCQYLAECIGMSRPPAVIPAA